MPKKTVARDPAVYSLKVAKKGTEQLPIILQFTDHDVFWDTYSEIQYRRPDLEILDKCDGSMVYQSVNQAIETIDVFLR